MELQQHFAVMNEIRALNEKIDRLAATLPVPVDVVDVVDVADGRAGPANHAR
ncbi:hypothetical protein ACFHYQ_19835 [Sphaerimonospora cavernae]|uniref:Uncharacterized protein n=1 Tax=Sphaerimonospora cavernae TaxID=1740611 RepID=A0ABV6U7W1_9ACTN